MRGASNEEEEPESLLGLVERLRVALGEGGIEMTTADRLQSVTRQLSLMKSERDFWIAKARKLSLGLAGARQATKVWMARAHKLEDEVTAARAGQDSEREAREMVARTLDSSLTALKLALDDRTRFAMEASRAARLERRLKEILDAGTEGSETEI